MAGGLVQALGAAAEQARKEKGLSREQIAASLGASLDTVRRFERGETFAGLDDVLKVYDSETDASLLDLLAEAERTLKQRGRPQRNSSSSNS